MENPAFAVLEDPAFSVQYPRGWSNVKSMMKLAGGAAVVAAYSDVPRRKGFLGKIGDAFWATSPPAGFYVMRLAASEIIDEDIFKTIRSALAQGDPDVITEEKKEFKGKDSYCSTVDAGIGLGERKRVYTMWVQPNQDYSIALVLWATIDSLPNYEDSFSRILESFEVK